MSAVIDKPPLWRTALSLFKGFDGWLALAILILMGIGLTAMYSSGFDHGTRFVDHSRNMLLAWAIILAVAMVPQQRLPDGCGPCSHRARTARQHRLLNRPPSLRRHRRCAPARAWKELRHDVCRRA